MRESITCFVMAVMSPWETCLFTAVNKQVYEGI